MKIKNAKKLIYKVLSSMPIDVVDEDEGEVWESCNYELFTPRDKGDYKGSREIGAANIVTAFNLLHQKMLISELSKEEGFSECLEEVIKEFWHLKVVNDTYNFLTNLPLFCECLKEVI